MESIKPKNLFDIALNEMEENDQCFWGPKSFQDYLEENNKKGINTHRTAQYISIDSYNELDTNLKAKNCMILRLGHSKGTGTQFCLVKSQKGPSKYFLFDQETFGNLKCLYYKPPLKAKNLFPFYLMPSVSETSLVNYSFASGLFNKALELDDLNEFIIPATGSSTYTFSVKPHSQFDVVTTHKNGQIQVDALFIGQRQGKQHLFVLEAKTNMTFKSIAKHKLIYPILAFAGNVPKEIPIIPLYLKVFLDRSEIHFFIAECHFADPRKKLDGIDQLQVVEAKYFITPYPSI